MRRWTKWGAPFVAGFALLTATPSPAFAKPAKPKVAWVRVDVPERQDSARLTKLFRKILDKASRDANFGPAKSVNLTARITQLRGDVHGDVLQIQCTVMGRVAGGAGAKSRISYGGSPDHKEDLEREVLTMVANGLVARLAQIVRAHPSSTRAVR